MFEQPIKGDRAEAVEKKKNGSALLLFGHVSSHTAGRGLWATEEAVEPDARLAPLI
jgi:hypothetical protein